MAQTFYPITPTEITPGGAGSWQTMDASGSVPANATGVILHIVNTSAGALHLGLRKNGSTDDRSTEDFFTVSHCWAMIGVDASRYFEAYVESTTDIDIYVVGYTMAGVTFKTNADDMSLGATTTWTAIDCSTEAPSAIGLIFEVLGYFLPYEFGFRKNGSSDDRHYDVELDHSCFGAIIGCDASQICEGYIENTNVDFFLVGYITDGATFNTNATDVSLGSTGSYADLTALPDENPNMGFIEVINTDADTPRNYGLRKNGQSGGYYDIYYDAVDHPWAIVECDESRLIEGKIESTGVDFFVVGYSTVPAAPTVVTPPTISLILTEYIPSIIIGTVVTPTTLSLILTTYAPPLIEGTVITPSTLNLTITTYIPTITATGNIEVIPSTLSLVITAYSPILKEVITPSTLNLILTKYAPSVIKGTVVTPTTLSLILTTYAPLLIEGTVVTPTTLSLSITAYAPILKEVITPSTISLILTEYVPSIIEGTVITPTTLSLILTKYAPVLIAGTVITPGKLGLILTGYAPILKEVITPGVLHLLLTEYAPDIIFGVLPLGALGYIIEVRDSSGNLLAFLENATGINLVEQLNRPPMLDFRLPADDSKISHIDPDNEYWLRNYETGVLIKKFLIGRRRDTRR